MLARLNRELSGRYLVEREIGRGGMATVWLATDLRAQQAVAVKVLQPALAGAIGADRFTREVKLTATLHHPSIVPVLDTGVIAGPITESCQSIHICARPRVFRSPGSSVRLPCLPAR